MAKFETHDEIIETIVDYKKGLRNLNTGSAELSRLSGLTPEIAAVFLKNMKRDNVTGIRGYSKEPENARLAKERIRQQKRGQ